MMEYKIYEMIILLFSISCLAQMPILFELSNKGLHSINGNIDSVILQREELVNFFDNVTLLQTSSNSREKWAQILSLALEEIDIIVEPDFLRRKYIATPLEIESITTTFLVEGADCNLFYILFEDESHVKLYYHCTSLEATTNLACIQVGSSYEIYHVNYGAEGLDISNFESVPLNLSGKLTIFSPYIDIVRSYVGDNYEQVITAILGSENPRATLRAMDKDIPGSYEAYVNFMQAVGELSDEEEEAYTEDKIESQHISVEEISDLMKRFAILQMSGESQMCGFFCISHILSMQGIKADPFKLQSKYKAVRLTEIDCVTILAAEGATGAFLFIEVDGSNCLTVRYFSNRVDISTNYGFINHGSHWDLLIFGIGTNSMTLGSAVVYSFDASSSIEVVLGDIGIIGRLLDRNADLVTSIILSNLDPLPLLKDVEKEIPGAIQAYKLYIEGIEKDIESMGKLEAQASALELPAAQEIAKEAGDESTEVIQPNEDTEVSIIEEKDQEEEESVIDDQDVSDKEPAKDNEDEEEGKEEEGKDLEEDAEEDEEEEEDDDKDWDEEPNYTSQTQWTEDDADFGYSGHDFTSLSHLNSDCRCISTWSHEETMTNISSQMNIVIDHLYTLSLTFTNFKTVNGRVWSNIVMIDDCSYYNICRMSAILLRTLEINQESFYRDWLSLFSSLVLKYRHEIINSIFSTSRSDIAFCHILPISSQRTPDVIEILSDKKVIILEITVVSDVARGFFQKGEGSGGKYYPEVRELKTLGWEVEYKNIVVKDDMSNLKDYQSYFKSPPQMSVLTAKISQLNTIIRKLYTYISDSFSNALPNNIESYRIKNYSSLITGPNHVANNEFIRYSFDLLSLKIKSLFDKKWDLLVHSLQNLSDAKLRLKINPKTSFFEFFEDVDGLPKSVWLKIVVKKDVPVDYVDVLGPKGSRTGSDLIITVKNLNSSLVNKALRSRRLGTEISNITSFVSNHSPHPERKSPSFNPDRVSTPMDLNIVNPFDATNYEDSFVNRLYELLSDEMNRDVAFEDFQTHVPKLPSYLLSSNVANFSHDYSTAYLNHLVNVNDSKNIINYVYKPKNSFLYPFANSHELGESEQVRAKFYLDLERGAYSRQALDKIISLKEVRAKVDMSSNPIYTAIQKKLMQLEADKLNAGGDPLTYFNSPEHLQYKRKRKELYREMEAEVRNKAGSHSDGIKAVSMGVGWKSLWRTELSHLKGGGEVGTGPSTSYNNGIFLKKDDGLVMSKSEVSRSLNRLFETMLELVTKSNYDVLDMGIGRDCSSLNELKKLYLDQITPAYTLLKQTRVYHAAKAVSDMCTSLHYFSTTSCGKDMLMFDNFGANGFILVKGGRKIYQNSRSRWYKLYFMIPQGTLEFQCPNGSSFESHYVEGQYYCSTPWLQMHETLVTDGMFFCHKLSSLMLTASCQTDDDPMTVYNRLALNLALGFHQKRKTESKLHQIRYVMVNAFSYFTDYSDLLKDVTLECKDLLQTCMFLSLGHGLTAFLKSVNDFSQSARRRLGELMSNDELNIYHPISGITMKNLSDISFGIYLTSLMSKAPVDNSSEQTLDLHAVGKSFQMFSSDVGSTDIKEVLAKTSVDISDADYFQKLFKKDLNFDPKLTWLVGRFVGDYMLSKISSSNLSMEFDEIISEPYHTIANTSGLRGRYFDNEFFGKKGYYVVFKDMPQLDQDVVKDILNSDMTTFEKRRKIEMMNITIIDKFSEFIDDTPVLHMVHKIQKGGEREIYVMSYPTKVKQQAIEKFIKRLCSLLPNEMINIPSNKRTKWMHKKMNEKEKGLDFKPVEVNHTYDCRRWAPHSNLLKYYYFMSGMAHVLPAKFVKIFMVFWDQYWEKILVVRGGLGDSYKKNKAKSEWFDKTFTPVETVYVNNHLNKKTGKKTKTEERKNLLYKSEMKFSFMMGIFNYLSSLHHASTQLYTRYIIQRLVEKNRITKKNLNYQSTVSFIAHSDDSGGKSQNKNFNSLCVSTAVHEIMLKTGNMMISKKKTCISRVFFELLSILYLAGVLIPMTAKFSSNLAIAPTDNGYADDMKTSISKCIEMVIAGGTFQQAYVIMKINSSMIRYFYSLRITNESYNRPLHCLGMPDGHPMMYILAGSAYDHLRIKAFSEKDWGYYEKLHALLTAGKGSLKPSYTSKNPYKDKFKSYDNLLSCMNLTDIEKEMTIHIDKSTTVGNLIQFSHLKNDLKFAWSLDYESRSRRITRAKWSIVAKCLETPYGMINYNILDDLVSGIKIFCDTQGGYTIPEFASKLKDDFDMSKIDQQILNHIQLREKILIGFDDIRAVMKMLDSLKFRMDIINPIPSTVRPTVIKLDVGMSPIGSDFSVERLMVRLFAPRLLPLMKSPYREEIHEETLRRIIPPDLLGSPAETIEILKMFKNRTKKMTYIYAQVPRFRVLAEDYRGFMDLLSYNSLYCKEIKGLKVPLTNRMSLSGEIFSSIDMITNDDIAFEIYNTISTIYSTETREVLQELEVDTPQYKGKLEGCLESLVTGNSSPIAKALSLLSLKILYSFPGNMGCYIEMKELSSYCMYYFEVEQMKTQTKWWGSGRVIFYHRGDRIKVDIEGEIVVSLTVPFGMRGLTSAIRYIDLFCVENGYPPLTKNFRFRDDLESCIIYNHHNSQFEIGECSPNYMCFPVYFHENVILQGSGYVQPNYTVKMEVGIDEYKKAFVTVGQGMSSGSMSGMVFKRGEKTQQLNKILGMPDIAVDDTVEYLKRGLPISVEKMVSMAPNSEIYRLIFENSRHSGSQFPSDSYGSDEITGSVIDCLMGEKERNPKYKFYPDMSYLPAIVQSSRHYTGTHLAQAVQSGKKAFEAMTKEYKTKMTDDLAGLINKSFDIGTVDRSRLRDILKKWGGSTVKYAVTLFDQGDETVILDSMLEASQYVPEATAQIALMDELFWLATCLKESENLLYRKDPLCRTGLDRWQWFDSLIEYLLENESRSSRNEYGLGYLAIYKLLSFISGMKNLKKFANKERASIKLIGFSKIKIKRSTLRRVSTLMHRTFIMGSTYSLPDEKTEKGRQLRLKEEKAMLRREIYNLINPIRLIFDGHYYPIEQVFRGTGYMEKGQYPYVHLFEEPYGPYSRMKKDDFEEFSDTADLDDPDELEDKDFCNLLKKYVKPVLSGKIYSCNSDINARRAGSECMSNISGNIMARVINFRVPSKGARRGGIYLGVLSPDIAKKASWGNSYQLVMIAADKGLYPFRKMGVYELRWDELPEPPIKESTILDVMIRDPSWDGFKQLNELVVEYRKKLIGRFTKEEEKEASSSDVYKDVYRRHIAKVGRPMSQTDLATTIAHVLGNFRPEIFTKIDEDITQIIRSEKEPEYIQGMTVIPSYLGSIKNRVAPKSVMQIIQEPKVIAELGLFGTDMHLNLVSGLAEVSEDVEQMVINSSEAAMMLSSGSSIHQNIVAAVEVLYSVMKNIRVTKKGDLNVNNSIIRYCNVLLRTAKSNSKEVLKTRAVPGKIWIYDTAD